MHAFGQFLQCDIAWHDELSRSMLARTKASIRSRPHGMLPASVIDSEPAA